MQPGIVLKPHRFQYTQDFENAGAPIQNSDVLTEDNLGNVVCQVRLRKPPAKVSKPPAKVSKPYKKPNVPQPDICRTIALPNHFPKDLAQIGQKIQSVIASCQNPQFTGEFKDTHHGSGFQLSLQLWQQTPQGQVIYNVCGLDSEITSQLLVRERSTMRVLASIPLPTSGLQLSPVIIHTSPELSQKFDLCCVSYTREIGNYLSPSKIAQIINNEPKATAIEHVECIVVDTVRSKTNKDFHPATATITRPPQDTDTATILCLGTGETGHTVSRKIVRIVEKELCSQPVQQANGGQNINGATNLSNERKSGATQIHQSNQLFSIASTSDYPYQTGEMLKNLTETLQSINKDFTLNVVETQVFLEGDDRQNFVCRHTVDCQLNNGQNFIGMIHIEFISTFHPSWQQAQMFTYVTFDETVHKALPENWHQHSSFRTPINLTQEMLQLPFDPTSDQLQEIQTRFLEERRSRWVQEAEQQLNPLRFYSSFLADYNGFLNQVYDPIVWCLHNELLNFKENFPCYSPAERLCHLEQIRALVREITRNRKYDAVEKNLLKLVPNEWNQLRAQLDRETLFMTVYGQKFQQIAKLPLALSNPNRTRRLPYRDSWERTGYCARGLMCIPGCGLPFLYYCWVTSSDKKQLQILRGEYFRMPDVHSGDKPGIQDEQKKDGSPQITIVLSAPSETTVQRIYPPPVDFIPADRKDEKTITIAEFLGKNVPDQRRLFGSEKIAKALYLEANSLLESTHGITNENISLFLLTPAFLEKHQSNTAVLAPYLFLSRYFNQLMPSTQVNLPGAPNSDATQSTKRLQLSP